MPGSRHYFDALLDPYHCIDEDLAQAPEEMRSLRERKQHGRPKWNTQNDARLQRSQT